MQQYLTTGEVANHFHVTVNTVKRWVMEGKLRAILTPGGHYRIRESEFKNFIQKYAPHSDPKKILVIDDDHAQLTLLIDTLSSAGKDYIVDSSMDGYEALIKIGEFKPDLILLDIMMPKLDGIQVIKKIRTGNTTKNIKIIVITAYPEKLVKNRNIIQDFFIKPVDLDILKQRVNELLGGEMPMEAQ